MPAPTNASSSLRSCSGVRSAVPAEMYAPGPGNDRNGAIVLKNSFSAMFDFLRGLRARHKKSAGRPANLSIGQRARSSTGLKTVLSGDVPSNCHLASFRHARFFDFSTKSGKTGRQLISNRASAQRRFRSFAGWRWNRRGRPISDTRPSHLARFFMPRSGP